MSGVLRFRYNNLYTAAGPLLKPRPTAVSNIPHSPSEDMVDWLVDAMERVYCFKHSK